MNPLVQQNCQSVPRAPPPPSFSKPVSGVTARRLLKLDAHVVQRGMAAYTNPTYIPKKSVSAPKQFTKVSSIEKRRETDKTPPSVRTKSTAIVSSRQAARQPSAKQVVRENGLLSARAAQHAQQAQADASQHSPAYILTTYRHELTSYEQTEILQYAKIYYHGGQVRKLYDQQGINSGYDDARGDYVGLLHDHVAYRYESLSLLGSGSFGKVYKAVDHATGATVALKIIRNRRRFHRQGLIEVKLLEALRDNDPRDDFCTVRIVGSFYFRSHLCIVFELLSMNLYELLLKSDLKGLSLSLVRKFALQVLSAFSYAKKLRIIHADFKPENVLLRAPDKSGIKVIDWGSGAYVNETIYTYIQSRFYRAPEVILGLPYGQEIDMWSVGCVLAELYMGYPIFPGENEVDQLGKIVELLGMPPRDMVAKSPRKNEFFVSTNGTILGMRLKTKHKPLTKQLSAVLSATPDFASFIAGFLQWDPNRRCTPDVALAHPWIQEGVHMLQAQASGGTVRSASTGAVSKVSGGGHVFVPFAPPPMTSNIGGRGGSVAAAKHVADRLPVKHIMDGANFRTGFTKQQKAENREKGRKSHIPALPEIGRSSHASMNNDKSWYLQLLPEGQSGREVLRRCV